MTIAELKNSVDVTKVNNGGISAWVDLRNPIDGTRRARLVGIGRKYARVMLSSGIQSIHPWEISRVTPYPLDH